MIYTMQVYIETLKNQINRKIKVKDTIKIETFCQYVITSLNGNCKHLFQLIKNDEETYLGPDCDIILEEEVFMEDKTLSDLDLVPGDKLLLNYDFKTDWDFIIKVEKVEKNTLKEDFTVVSGKGFGIIEDIRSIDYFKWLLEKEDKEKVRYLLKSDFPNYKNYDKDEFSIELINNKIRDFLQYHYEYVKPKRYELNVSLEDFNKEIKRKITVDSNVNLDDFCRAVIVSMNGDLSHGYGLKKGAEYIEDDILQSKDMNYLELKPTQRLKVIYDWGDNWVFNIRVSKVIDGYNTHKRRCMVLSGKGYGIIDDCGGTYGLYEIIEGINKDWGEYDINNFDIDKINREIDAVIIK